MTYFTAHITPTDLPECRVVNGNASLMFGDRLMSLAVHIPGATLSQQQSWIANLADALGDLHDQIGQHWSVKS